MSGVGGGNGLGGNGLRGGGALLSGIKTGISGFTGGPPPPPPIAPLGDLSRSLFNAGAFIDLSTLPGGPQVGIHCSSAEGIGSLSAQGDGRQVGIHCRVASLPGWPHSSKVGANCSSAEGIDRGLRVNESRGQTKALQVRSLGLTILPPCHVGLHSLIPCRVALP